MAVDDTATIDFISVSADGTEVELTIADHLDWQDPDGHSATLQRKIYRYLDFVSSGELLQRYPSAAGKPVVIRVVAEARPPAKGDQFIRFVSDVVRGEGPDFRFEVRKESNSIE
jgi:hypothetical protein